MLALRCATVLLMAAPLFACGEEDPDPLVNEDIAWQLGCGETGGPTCGSYPGHDQTKSEDGFSVTCVKTSVGLDITITDPGSSAANRPRSELRIRRLDPEANTCSVTVSDSQTINSQAFTYTGECDMGDCTVAGSTGGDWDFDGTLHCEKLVEDGVVDQTLVRPGTTSGIVLKVDNCE
jgi:hypothetical protein